jgi:hypothetical protein
MANPTPFRFSRRSLLAGALATAAGRTLLAPRIAEAQGMAPPRRILLIHRPMGSWPDQWFPESPGTLGELPVITRAFDAVKHKMVLMKGVDTGADHGQNGDKHAMGNITMLTGGMPIQPPGTSQDDLNDSESKTIAAGGPSIEQFILQNEPSGHLASARIPSVQLAGTVRSSQGAGFGCLRIISHAGYNQGLFGESRSDVAFNTNLGQAVEEGMDEAAIARAQMQGKSVLDFVKSDLDRVRRQVPRSQYVKLDAHLDAIRQLERRITTPIGAMCTRPDLRERPGSGLSGAEQDEWEHEWTSRNMLQILKTCFQCDVTRVASLTFADGNNTMRPLMYVGGSTFQNSSDHHGVSHSGTEEDAVRAKTETDAWYSRMVGEMLAEMDQIPEGGAGETLLDHTLVVYFSECSLGDDHSPRDMPVALFGGKFLNMKVGRYVRYDRSIYINDVWTSLLNAWGIDVDQFGDPRWCTSSGPDAAPGLFG